MYLDLISWKPQYWNNGYRSDTHLRELDERIRNLKEVVNAKLWLTLWNWAVNVKFSFTRSHGGGLSRVGILEHLDVTSFEIFNAPINLHRKERIRGLYLWCWERLVWLIWKGRELRMVWGKNLKKLSSTFKKRSKIETHGLFVVRKVKNAVLAIERKVKGVAIGKGKWKTTSWLPGAFKRETVPELKSVRCDSAESWWVSSWWRSLVYVNKSFAGKVGFHSNARRLQLEKDSFPGRDGVKESPVKNFWNSKVWLGKMCENEFWSEGWIWRQEN